MKMKQACSKWCSDPTAEMSPDQTNTNTAELTILRIPENPISTVITQIFFFTIFAATVETFIFFFEYRRYKNNRSTTDKREATDKHEATIATTHQNTPQLSRTDKIEILSETV